MILFDEAGGRSTAAVEAVDAGADAKRNDDCGDRRSAREDVEAWLDAVALCFGGGTETS